MAVHFKFRSAVAYDSIDLDDLYISVRNLKQRIVEHKNLASNRTIDFDLVITDSQTGEEYRDENFLVPRNTSVIIKRVPAAKTKVFLPSVEPPKPAPKPIVPAPAPTRLPSKTDVEGDDFGVDLFASPAPAAAPPAKADEDAKIMEMVSKSTLEWQKFDTSFSQPRGGKGRGRGSGPPAGYVCHRCGQPGHFIQQCPTNGDPNYDIKKVRLPVGIPRTRLRIDQEGSYVLPDGSVAAMQPDENLFAKEADALMAAKATTEAPPELRCPLCHSTFKEAVMIPCCHYSFCDKCIRQNLMLKGQCPQCGSVRFKNDDLLPNIALRQAIDKFLESQATIGGVADQFTAAHDLADSVSQHLNAPTDSKHSADETNDGGKLRDTSSGVVVVAESSVASKTDANLHHPVIPKDASGTHLGLEGNEPVRENGDGGNSSEHLVPKGPDDLTLESEVSKGKKKKKRARVPGDGGSVDAPAPTKQGERFCFQCGSPGHLAKDCVENVGNYPPHPGMFPPGGGFPLAPYGSEMFWPGPAVPFTPGYGDGLYGPGLAGAMPPGGAYQMPPCLPPPYAGVPPMWFGEHPGMMNGDMMKHQDRDRRGGMSSYRGDWSHSKSSYGRGRNGTFDRHSQEYGSRSYSEKYRDHEKYSSDKYGAGDKYSSDKYASEKYSSDKYSSEKYAASEKYPPGDKYSSEKYPNSGEKYSSEKYPNSGEKYPSEKHPNTGEKYSSEKEKYPSERPHSSEKQHSSEKYKRGSEESSRRKPERESVERSREKEKSRSEYDRRYSDGKDERRSEAGYKEERKSKFSSRPGESDEREKQGSRSRGAGYEHHREGDYESDDGGRRKKRREKSREDEDRSYSKYSSASKQQSESGGGGAGGGGAAGGVDDHSRWRPDYHEEDRYWDERKHSSSSSRHHHHRR